MYIFHNYSLFLEIVSFSIIRNFATLVSQRKSVIGRYFYAVSQFYWRGSCVKICFTCNWLLIFNSVVEEDSDFKKVT